MKKSQNLLLLKVLLGVVHLLVFSFTLYTSFSSSFGFVPTAILLGLIVSDAFFMQYIARKDEQALSGS